MGRLYVIGGEHLAAKIRCLVPDGLAVELLQGASLSAATRLKPEGGSLSIVEIGEMGLSIREFLDSSDEGGSFLYVLAPRYDLEQAEQMLMGRERVIGYVALNMLDDPQIQEEIRGVLRKVHAQGTCQMQEDRKPVGWALGVRTEDYEERRLVSLFIGEMGEFILRLKLIVKDLRREWAKQRFLRVDQDIPIVRQLDDWQRWELLRESPIDKQQREASQRFKVDQQAKKYRLFQSTPPSGFKPTTLLIRGETGTGKSLIARLIHKWTFGSGNILFTKVCEEHRLLELNCIGIPDQLLESEVFGAMGGAYTDRGTTYPGRILAAYGGTLFLDEIGDMSVHLQGKLLKFLDDSRVVPLSWMGEGIFVPLNIVAATNADIEEKIERGTFREDLYYRLRGHEVRVPSLRERVWDLERMVDFILQNPATNQDEQGQRYVQFIHDDALAMLKDYEFPGNFRELESVLKEAIIHARMEGMDTLWAEHIIFPSPRASNASPSP